VSRNSKRKRDAKVAKRERAPRQRTATRPAAGHSPVLGSPAGGMTAAEQVTVRMLTTAWVSRSGGQTCPGPVVVHQSGGFECHGPCSAGGVTSAMNVWHPEDATEPCPGRVAALRGACPRCRHATPAFGYDHPPPCSGTEIDHDDGSHECTAGQACAGPDALHMTSMSCSFLSACGRCTA
jgi:hypothetical protein